MVERIVNIDILGNHEGTIIESHPEGKYIKKDNSEYLEYYDDEKIRNLLKISDDQIMLTKYTTPSTNMLFKKGEKFICNYQTNYGIMRLEMQTELLEVNRSGYALDIYIKYYLINNGEKSEKELTIKTN